MNRQNVVSDLFKGVYSFYSRFVKFIVNSGVQAGRICFHLLHVMLAVKGLVHQLVIYCVIKSC